MEFRNEARFEESLNRFAEYAKTERYSAEERRYKDELAATLGKALSDDALASPGFIDRLSAAVKSQHQSISNIAHWTDTDDFAKYLKTAPPDRIADLLRNLFTENTGIGDRIDAFKKAVDTDYVALSLSQKQYIRLGLISILLAARSPDRYVFYRPSIIKSAEQRWGFRMSKSGSEGAKYKEYLAFMESLKPRVSAALGRAADGIDVHSFLWVNHGDRITWQEKLREWLKANPRTMPAQDRELLQAFWSRFPRESLKDLTLEQYALSGDKDSFCYWIEFQTKSLGRH